jgi:KDO2-lipid IV(A) lauroyltransferase
MNLGARIAIATLWLLHWLPVGLQSALGAALGALLHRVARSRRRIARRNIELCLPELDARARDALEREHFRWLGRSVLERGLLWFAPRERLERLIEIEGDIGVAERVAGAHMWLVPHFLGLEAAGLAVQLFQSRPACSIYARQSDPVFDAAMRRGRSRFGDSVLLSRKEGVKPLMRAMRDEHRAFFNLPDMDFGRKDSAFVPFFGVPAATLLAPGRLAKVLEMTVQPVMVRMLEGGGWRVSFGPAWTGWPSGAAEADAAAMNRWIESEVRKLPAQYLWVHKRFKTRPAGEGPLY